MSGSYSCTMLLAKNAKCQGAGDSAPGCWTLLGPEVRKNRISHKKEAGGIVKPAGLGDGHVPVPARHPQAALEGATQTRSATIWSCTPRRTVVEHAMAKRGRTW